MDILKTFSFELPTRIEYGVGCASRLSKELSFLGAKKPMIVTDKGIVDSGLLKNITVLLDEADIHYDLFNGVEPNPRDENVHRGAEMARNLQNDCLIAIGGGSSIDCAKGISIIATHGGRIQDFQGAEKVFGTPLPIITIPTTAGSGSEVTFSSVITDTKEKTKFSVRSTKIAAPFAFSSISLILAFLCLEEKRIISSIVFTISIRSWITSFK